MVLLKPQTTPKGLLHTCCTDCIRMRICQCEQHQVIVTDRGLIDILSFRHIRLLAGFTMVCP